MWITVLTVYYIISQFGLGPTGMWTLRILREWQPGKTGTQSIFAEYQRYHNPWFMVNEWLRGHYKNDIYGYVSGNYKFNDHLNLTGRTQITAYDLLRTEKMPFSAHPYGREENLGDYREDRRNLFENNTDLQLNYNYTVRFLNLSGLVGGNSSFSYNSNWTSTDYMNVPEVYSFSNSKNPIQASSFYSDMRVLAVTILWMLHWVSLPLYLQQAVWINHLHFPRVTTVISIPAFQRLL